MVGQSRKFIFLGCFFVLIQLFKTETATSEFIYRHHFYDHSDDYETPEILQYYDAQTEEYVDGTSSYELSSNSIASDNYFESTYSYSQEIDEGTEEHPQRKSVPLTSSSTEILSTEHHETEPITSTLPVQSSSNLDVSSLSSEFDGYDATFGTDPVIDQYTTTDEVHDTDNLRVNIQDSEYTEDTSQTDDISEYYTPLSHSESVSNEGDQDTIPTEALTDNRISHTFSLNTKEASENQPTESKLWDNVKSTYEWVFNKSVLTTEDASTFSSFAAIKLHETKGIDITDVANSYSSTEEGLKNKDVSDSVHESEQTISSEQWNQQILTTVDYRGTTDDNRNTNDMEGGVITSHTEDDYLQSEANLEDDHDDEIVGDSSDYHESEYAGWDKSTTSDSYDSEHWSNTSVSDDQKDAEARSGDDENNKGLFTKADDDGWSSVVTNDYSECNADKLVCDDGKCIDPSMVCDGKVDCESGEDEDPLICKDQSDENKRDMVNTGSHHSNKTFTCDNGETIALENAYDTIEDCEDGSDETMRGHTEKLQKCFQCEIDGMCLDPSVVCNQVIDCPNGVDEDEISCKDQYSKADEVVIEDEDINDFSKDHAFLIFNSLEPVTPHGVIVLTCDIGISFLDADIEHVTWYKDGVLFSKLGLNESRYQLDNGLLHVSNVQDKDLGIYKCVVKLTNGTVVSKSKHITYGNGLTTDEQYDESVYISAASLSTQETFSDQSNNGTVEYEPALTESTEQQWDREHSLATIVDDQHVHFSSEAVINEDAIEDTEVSTNEQAQLSSFANEDHEVEQLDETHMSEQFFTDARDSKVVHDEDGQYIDGNRSVGTEAGDVHRSDETEILVEQDLYDDHADQQTGVVDYEVQTDIVEVVTEETVIDNWISEFQDYVKFNPPFFEKVTSLSGEEITIRCPILSMVPMEAVSEMYLLHGETKTPMNMNIHSKLGMINKIAVPQDTGEWKCFIRFHDDENPHFISYTEVDVKEIPSTSTEYDSYHIVYEDGSTTQSPVHLPSETELVEWIRTTQPATIFDLSAVPSYIEVPRDTPVSISCVSDSVPPGVNIYFIKTDPYGLAVGKVYKYHEGTHANYTLTIRGVDDTTVGHYQCIAMTQDKRAVKADFVISIDRLTSYLPIITEVPTISESPFEPTEATQLMIKDSFFSSGSVAYLKCKGVPMIAYPNIQWKINNDMIDRRNSKYFIFDDILFVRKVSPETAGVYSCHVPDSNYAAAQGKLLIQHSGSPYLEDYDQDDKVYVDRRAISLRYGDSLTIKCSSTVPTESYTWIKIKDGERSVVGNEQILNIPSVDDVGDSVYQCQIMDSDGQSAYVSTFVYTSPPDYPPIAITPKRETLTVWIIPHEMEVTFGDYVLLSCRSNLPATRSIWKKINQDGSHQDLTHKQELRVLVDSASKIGAYECTIETKDGQIAQTRAQLNLVENIEPSISSTEREDYAETENIILKRCGLDEATCRDGSCIKRNKLCDGVSDCPDGTDEKGCGQSSQIEGDCNPDQFLCSATRQCIQKIWLCDGENDCDDGSDESIVHCDNIHTSSPGACKQSEFQCRHTNFTQCIPKAYVCDETVDCDDQSDEMSCVKPTVIIAPETEKQVIRGDTLELRCIARGNPPPFINWRLNWGFVCGDGFDNGRCVMKQELDKSNLDVVIGTLTVSNMQPRDAGAYSCEAINSKGFHFAIPDAFVQVRSASGPVRCNEIGTSTSDNNVCQCKPTTMGSTCSFCKPGYFDLSADDINGCKPCYCSGLTDQCSSTSDRYKLVPINLIDNNQPWRLGQINLQPSWQESPILDQIRGVLTVNNFDGPSGNVYWQPSNAGIFPLGNIIRSYGGNLNIEMSKHLQERQILIDGPVVFIKGANINVVYDRPTEIVHSNNNVVLSILMNENSFRRTDGILLDRSQFMRILSNVTGFGIWAGDSSRYNGKCSLISVSFEIAQRDGDGRQSTSVEECRCPNGYTGSSCEKCSDGFTWKPTLDTMVQERKECYPCLQHCNRKSNQCDAITGSCIGCADNTAGDRCQDCLPGYKRDQHTHQCTQSALLRREILDITIDGQLYNEMQKIIVVVRPGERRIVRVVAKDSELLPSTVWLRVESNGKRVQLPSGMRQVGNDLIIEKANPNMAGVYEIRLQLRNGHIFTPNILLQYNDVGSHVPTPSLDPQGIIQKEINEPVTIDLNLNGFPINRVVWTKDNMQLPSQVIQDYYRLVITRLSPELCGTYEAKLVPQIPIEPITLQTTIECRSSSYSGIYGVVNESPRIHLSPSEVNLSQGQAMVVSYEILGRQPVHITWHQVSDSSDLVPMPSSFTVLADSLILNNTKLTDAGVYKVKAKNSFGTDEATLVVHVKSELPVVYVEASEPDVHFESTVYEAYPGQSIRIHPNIRCNIPYVTKWTAGQGQSLPHGVYSEGNALVIESMSQNIAGSYVIEVSSQGTTVRVPIEIELKEQQRDETERFNPPQSARLEAYLPPKLTVEEGGHFNVKCQPRGDVGYSQLRYTWIKHGHDTSEFLPSHIQADGSTLRGSNVQMSDYAYYMCTIKMLDTGEESVAYTLLDVQRAMILPVAVIFPTKSIEVYEGERTSFTCYAQEGEPYPTITWTRLDGSLIEYPSRAMDGQLELIDISKKTAGEYKCILSNSAGNDSAIATVTIKAPPGIKIMTNPEYMDNISDEDHKYIQCVASGTPTPDVFWTHNGRNITTPEAGYSLLTVKPKELTSGVHDFECIAHNIHETKRYLFRTNVIVSPQLPWFHYQDRVDNIPISLLVTANPQTPTVGEDVLVTCYANRSGKWQHPVTYIWKHDNRQISANLNINNFDIHVIRQVRKSDEGVYECEVDDGSATHTASFYLPVNGNDHPIVHVQDRLSMFGRSGDEIVMQCPMIVAPTVKVEWTKEKSVLPPRAKVVNATLLVISNAIPEDSGIYVCSISDGYRVIRFVFNLTINVKESKTLSLMHHTSPIELKTIPEKFSYGYRVVLHCSAISDEHETTLSPNKEYTWLKDGRQTIRSGVLIRGETLELYVQQSDLGVYTCDLIDKLLQTVIGSASVELVADPVRLGLVYSKPCERPVDVGQSSRTKFGERENRPVLIKIRPLQGNYRINGQIGFECDSSATNAEIRWRRITPVTDFSSNTRPEMNRIMFYRFTHEDIGQYVCKVRKNGKITKKFLHLDIDLSNEDVLFTYPEHELVISYGAPNINVTFLNPPSEFKRGGNIEVECHVSGQRSVPIAWSREKQEMSTNTMIRNGILKFQNFMEHNLGEYRCSAKTSVGELSKIIIFEPESFAGLSVNASLYKPRIEFQFLSSRSDFKAGGHVVVECVTSDSNAPVTWKKLKDTNSKSMRVRDRFLIISPFTEADLGTYECRATNNGHLFARSLEFDERNLHSNLLPLNEDTLPDIKLTMSDKNEYRTGGKVDITCVSEIDPSARIIWHRGNRKSLGPKTEIRDNILRFHEISVDDAGTYSCIATNSYGSQYISFDVNLKKDESVHIVNQHETKIPITRTQVPLIIEFLNPLSEFRRNGNISVMCYFGIDIDGTVEWSKVSNDRKLTLPLRGSTQINGPKLTFTSFDQEDLGMYQCVGRSDHGMVKRVVKLDADTLAVIKRITKIYGETESDKLQIVVEGSDINGRVKLWCRMGSARIAVKWEYEGGQINEEDNSIVQIGTRLIFSSFKPSHHGVYTCRARYNGLKMIKYIDTRMHIHNNAENTIIPSDWLPY